MFTLCKLKGMHRFYEEYVCGILLYGVKCFCYFVHQLQNMNRLLWLLPVPRQHLVAVLELSVVSHDQTCAQKNGNLNICSSTMSGQTPPAGEDHIVQLTLWNGLDVVRWLYLTVVLWTKTASPPLMITPHTKTLCLLLQGTRVFWSFQQHLTVFICRVSLLNCRHVTWISVTC